MALNQPTDFASITERSLYEIYLQLKNAPANQLYNTPGYEIATPGNPVTLAADSVHSFTAIAVDGGTMQIGAGAVQNIPAGVFVSNSASTLFNQAIVFTCASGQIIIETTKP